VKVSRIITFSVEVKLHVGLFGKKVIRSAGTFQDGKFVD